MMEDEVAALVVDNGSGKSESTLECNKRAVVHFQSQFETHFETQFETQSNRNSVKISSSEFRFSTKISFFGQISGSTILTNLRICFNE